MRWICRGVAGDASESPQGDNSPVRVCPEWAGCGKVDCAIVDLLTGRLGRTGPDASEHLARSVCCSGAEIKNPDEINCLTFDFEPQGRKYKAVNPTGDFNEVYGFCADKEKSCDTTKSKVSKYILTHKP